MGAINLHDRPTAGFASKLERTRAALLQLVADHPRAAGDRAPVVAQASSLHIPEP